jgi:uncharacterized protein YbdZ (MbtH family)/GNAT superfamily N-acetyltransferase
MTHGPQVLLVANEEGQHSIWPAGRRVPGGWHVVDGPGSREECLRVVSESWTDMRPRSLRGKESEAVNSPVRRFRAVTIDADDVESCARVAFDAFSAAAAHAARSPMFPSREHALLAFADAVQHDEKEGLAVLKRSEIAGCAYLDARGEFGGLGGVAVDPSRQGTGAGRALVEFALERAWRLGLRGVRLTCEADDEAALALYLKSGFEFVATLVSLVGSARPRDRAGLPRRLGAAADIGACARVAEARFGWHRRREIEEALRAGALRVVSVDEQVVAYDTGLTRYGHAAAVSESALLELFAGGAASFPPPGLLLPLDQSGLIAACLERGMRVRTTLHLLGAGEQLVPRGPCALSALG